MKVGDYVWYIPFKGADKHLHQRGRIKSITEYGIFVVFHCNDCWDEYYNYTAQNCKKEHLVLDQE